MILKPRADDDPRHTPVRLRRDLLAEGYHDRALARLRREGVLVRARHGAYVSGVDWARLDDAGRHGVLTRAVLRTAGTPAVASHVSAVPEYEGSMWGMDASTVHITREDGRAGRHEAGVRQHCGQLAEGDVVERNGIRVVSPTLAALEVTTVASVEAALCFVNHTLAAGLTTIEELRRRYESMDRWPGTLSTDLVLSLARADFDSLAESRVWYLCHRQHLPAPTPQVEVYDEQGRFVGRVDFAWPDLGVFLEFDGKVKYERFLRPGESVSDAVLREKRREDEICRVTGWRCIRVTWRDLDRPEELARKIRALLERSPR